MDVTLIDEGSRVGGRVCTETVEGFQLDCGFQVLLSSYPELKSFSMKDLSVKCYGKGAHIKWKGEWKFIANPFVHPSTLLKSPQGSVKGLTSLLLGLLKKAEEGTTSDFLDSLTAEKDWINSFVKPFMRGVFLESELSADAQRFMTLMKYFIRGRACLPNKGMSQLPSLMLRELERSRVLLKHKVVQATPNTVMYSSGKEEHYDAVVLALPLPQLKKLVPSIPEWKSLSTCCDYFILDGEVKQADNFLWLDGTPNAPINNFSFPSVVQPSYAKKGKTLLSATSLGPHYAAATTIQEYFVKELKIAPKNITHLKRYHIEHALPLQSKYPPVKTIEYEGFYLAGEAVSYPSINDAIASGKKAALALLAQN